MEDFIAKATPLIIALIFGAMGVMSTLLLNSSRIRELNEANPNNEEAFRLFLENIPQSLCLTAITFDIWALTVLISDRSLETDTAKFYNIEDKEVAVILLLLIHFLIYLWVLYRLNIIKGTVPSSLRDLGRREVLGSTFAVLSCILLQVL